jgi:hypothetical protein
VEGIYRDGKIELLQSPNDLPPTRVLVTFLPADGPIDLRARGIDQDQAAELRWGFGAAADDWDRPEMDVYDELKTAIAKCKLQIAKSTMQNADSAFEDLQLSFCNLQLCFFG